MAPKYCIAGNLQSTVIGKTGPRRQAEGRHLSMMCRFEGCPWFHSSYSGVVVVVSIGVTLLAEVHMAHHRSVGKVLPCSYLPSTRPASGRDCQLGLGEPLT